ncbi:hypothetical protein IFM89_011508, partial [Coptis chinensis]
CGTNAPLSAAQMLGEVSRVLKPGGVSADNLWLPNSEDSAYKPNSIQLESYIVRGSPFISS